MDHTHVNDWNEFAYLISADPRHLDAVQAMASWYSGWENSCRFIGKAWVIPEGCGATPSAVRAQGGATRATLAAATHSVNQPQFGNAGPSVESIYYHEKLWDVALTKEATFQITNGWFFQMYPPASYGNAWDTTCTVKPWSSLWHYVRCNVLGDMQNPLAWFGLASNNGNDCTGMGQPNAEPWVDCPAGYAAVGMWYYHHGVVQWSRAESWGMPMFYYVRRAWGNTALSLWGSSHWNPYLNDLYHAPSRGPGTNRPWVQTLTALFNGMKTTWSGGFTRDDQTWFHDNARFGFALASDGYIPQWRADLAVNSDMSPGTRDGCAVTAKTPNGCSWEYAWNWINSHLPKQNLWGSNPKYIIDPYPTIANLTCTPGGTSAVCTYTAPTNDICTYVAGTSAPADTLDANTGTGVLTDTSDGGGGRFRKIVIGSLTEATAYNLRITCGPRVTGISTGTGRTSTTFTTLTEGAGTTHVMKLGPMTGATTATVAYGDTSAVSGGTVGPTACTSGCSLTIPATSKKLLYVRITRKNASAVTLVQTAAQAVMVP